MLQVLFRSQNNTVLASTRLALREAIDSLYITTRFSGKQDNDTSCSLPRLVLC